MSTFCRDAIYVPLIGVIYSYHIEREERKRNAKVFCSSSQKASCWTELSWCFFHKM